MVNKNLVTYVKSTLAKGYSSESVKNRLISSGYPRDEVEAAVKKATQKVNMKLILGISALVVIVILIVLGLILVLRPLFVGDDGGVDVVGPTSGAKKGVNLGLDLDVDSFEAGDTLIFTVSVTNLGQEILDIEVESQILDSTGDIIVSKKESAILRTQYSGSDEFSLPNNLEVGNYVLRARVEYDGKEKVEEVDFEVVEELGVGVDATATPTQTAAEVARRIDLIVEKAQTDFVQAKELCLNELEAFEDQDNCLLRAGREAMKPSFCDSIRDMEKRDTCYLDLALNMEDYSLCDKIGNVYSRQACSALAG